MSPHSNRVLLAVLFAVLWTASMLWRAQFIDLKTVILAVIAGAGLVFTALSLSKWGQHIAPLYERVAFELVKQEGLTFVEAAEVLGATVAAVKLRAHRAYEALRAVLGDALERERFERSP